MRIEWTAKSMMVVGIVAMVACGEAEGEQSNDDDSTNTSVSCQSSSDCGEGYVCLIVGNDGGCAAVCTGDTNACGAQASCGGVGVLDVDVCQEPQPESTNGTAEAPAPEEQPRIPCKSDAECSAVQPGAICALFQGQRDCTIPCTAEAQCDMPSLDGFAIDFMTCIADEGSSTRKACLPDARCFTNPLACVTFGGMDGGGDNGGGGASCEPLGAECYEPSDCCSNTCDGGSCCVPSGGSCATDYDCCNWLDSCVDGTCQ